MTRRTALLLILLALVVAWYAFDALVPTDPEPLPQGVADVGPRVSEAVAEHYERLRVSPDARLLRAVEDVQRIVTGRAAPADAVAAPDGWQIRCDDVTVGVLEDDAAFAPQLELLVGWARARGIVARETAATREAPTAFYPAAASQALQEIEGRWDPAESHVRDAIDAARLLTGLVLQARDDLERADALAARAWAALAVARAMRPDAALGSEAALAKALGHSSHAARIADLLPEQDPRRAFVLREESTLAALAGRADASHETRFLAVHHFGARTDVDKWRAAWPEGEVPDDAAPALLLTGARTGFEASRFVPEATTTLLAHLWLDASVSSNIADAHAAVEMTADVEQAIGAATANLEGVFLDTAVLRGYWEAVLFTAVYRLVDFRLNQWASLPAVEEVLLRFDPEATGTVGALRDWTAAILASRRRNPDAAALLRVAREPSLGLALRQEALWRSWTAEQLWDSDLRIRERVFAFFESADARPDHRRRIAGIARANLYDLPLASKLDATVKRDDGFDRRRSSHVDESDATEAIWAVAVDETVGLGDRVEALRLAATRDVAPSRLRAVYESLWLASPGDTRVLKGYLDALRMDPSDPVTRERLCREFLAHPEWHRDLWQQTTLASLAGALRAQERFDEAWSLLEPAIAGQHGSVLSEGIHVLLAMGELERAEELARFTRERYPQAWTLAAHSKVLWRLGRFEEAASEMKEHGEDISTSHWESYVVPAFAEVFEGSELEVVLDAYDALYRHNIRLGGFLRYMAIADRFAEAGRSDVAFELNWRMARFNPKRFRDPEQPVYLPADPFPANHTDRMTHVSRAWRERRKWKGEDEARSWVQRAIPQDYAVRSVTYVYEEEAFELLWDLYPVPPSTPAFWLMRAHAIRRDETLDARHGDEVRAWFEKDAAPSLERDYGRVLLGIDPAESLLDLAITGVDLPAVALLFGAIAQYDGDLVGASRWYQVVADSRNRSHPARRQAFEHLRQWASAGKPLSEQ